MNPTALATPFAPPPPTAAEQRTPTPLANTAAAPQARRGVIIGEILSRDADGRIWLRLPDPEAHPACAACCLCDPADLTPGARVAILFQELNPDLAVVLGPVIADIALGAGHAPAKPESILLEAEQQITLRCGKSSIQLQKDGTLLIRGAYVLSRASGTNRIRGGNVQIN